MPMRSSPIFLPIRLHYRYDKTLLVKEEGMDTDAGRQRSTLRRIARRAMIDRGLLPDFSPAALAELDGIRATAAGSPGGPRDMRHLPWASIDNDDSRDLDQLTVAETLPE